MNQLEVYFGNALVVEHKHVDASRPVFGYFTFQVESFVFKGVSMQAISTQSAATMQAGTLATLSVEWKDKNGETVKVDGRTTWQSSDAGVLTVAVATGNSQIANIKSLGPIGAVNVQATADADLGEGLKTVTSTIAINVIAGEAVGGEITFTQSPAQTTPKETGVGE